jgi:hypothetical protein
MKRLKMLVVTILIALACTWGYAADAMKTLVEKESGVVITVPEKAPEFLTWPSMVIGVEELSNGVLLGLVESRNPAETVGVLSLWVVKNQKMHIVAFAAYYIDVSPNTPDLYEDLGFLQTGKPTGVLVPVDQADSLDAFKSAALKGLI